ncbi:metallophosphoesterase family protein [Anabaenopsis elenkinii]|jgi:3',5'-cyclic AMP phosphodiesterase CpdA|uniref:Metallophosphoesterase n=1 Tax=Anabaenopsis elenkinii CCIBt3563 TaxID=2779889 RepID=A0A7S6REJ8_9CYAN|nr:metallophosphoesterase [Anabaenopsis elenkinii]QOV23466.1 metallophosphoesterase [Anabaenopsis elenkinii CCIBt3563]
MNLKRREFLFLGTLGTMGTGLLGWKLSQHNTQLSDIPSSAVLAATPPKQNLLLRFTSVADTGTGARGQYAVAGAMNYYHEQNPYDVVVLAGDNIYNDGEIEKIGAVFERPYEKLLTQGVKFHACLGNHDIRTENGDPQIKYPGFNMQGRYYTFRRDAVQFFALDTNRNAEWENQVIWLEQELSQSDALWKVVFGHDPFYSSGHYGVSQSLIKRFTPLFKKYNVQLYINGHDHHYERTRNIDGTTYLTTGSGAGVRPVGRSQWTEYSAERLAFASYEVYPDRIEVKAMGTDKRIFDQGVIQFKSV